MSFTTPDMNLTLPTVGVTPGSDYAQLNNNAFQAIDSHDHTAGKGTPITPSGLQITSDLSFLLNNATNLRSVRMSSNLSPIAATGLDLDCVYVSGVDLYYNDGNGNQIRITSGGSVTGSTGTITGLPSGTAGVAYSSSPKSYIFSSASSVPAHLDFASAIMRNISTPTNAITLAVPSALAGAFTLTLPSALPGATSLLQVTSGGTIAASNTVTGTLTIGAGGAQLSNTGTYLNTNDGISVGGPLKAAFAPGSNVTVSIRSAGGSDDMPIAVSPVGTDSMVLMRGTVDGAANILAGSGFSASRPSTGHFTITFSTAFGSLPSVLATSYNSGGGVQFTVSCEGASTTSANFIVWSAGTATNAGFSFLIIGPRT